jgi:prophage regulatory protein
MSEDRLLRRKDVEARVGLSRTSIYRKMDEGDFPRPKRLKSGAVRWEEAKIEAWKASLPTASASP